MEVYMIKIDIVSGFLGAGKTTFIKGLVTSVTNLPTQEINSPTFTYLNIYEGTKTIYHFDLYRLKTAEEFIEMGFLDFLDNFCCIEWAEKIIEVLPKERLSISISMVDHQTRNLRFKGYGQSAVDLIEKCMDEFGPESKI